jgi:hypothetical protein
MKVKKLIFVIMVLAAMPVALSAADPEKAQIVTHKSNPVKCLAAVEINQVDGKQRQLPPGGFEIEPGEHTMKGRSQVDLRNCPPVETHSRKPVHARPLDWFFEAGKVYYVALDYSNPNRENWRTVVWKVIDADGEVIFDLTQAAVDLPN